MQRLIGLIDPLVEHGLREQQTGVSLTHTLRQIALIGALVGAGVSPREAIALVEREEASLIGREPAEAREYGQAGFFGIPFGKGAAMMPTGFGKQVPTGFGAQVPTGFGKQVPTGFGKQAPTGFGKQVPTGFGKQVPTGFGIPTGTWMQ